MILCWQPSAKTDAPLHLPHVWQSSLWKLRPEWQLQRLKPDVLLTFPFFLSSALFFLGRRTPSPAFDTVWTLTFASRHRTCCVIVTCPHRCLKSNLCVCWLSAHLHVSCETRSLYQQNIACKTQRLSTPCFRVVLAAVLGFGKARHHWLFSPFTSLQQLWSFRIVSSLVFAIQALPNCGPTLSKH